MIKAAMHRLTPRGVGKKIGYVYLSDTADGLLCEPDLVELPSGVHGFHIHEFGNVEPRGATAGGMAGEHYDPELSGRHEGPYGNGHLGDLPRLKVNADGTATTPVVAPRLTLNEVKGRALIIHSGGDNYTDHPPNGGGRSRIVGGIISNDCPYCRTRSDALILTLGVAAVGYFALRKRR